MRIAALNSASRIKNVRAQANHTATPPNKRHSRVSGFEGWYKTWWQWTFGCATAVYHVIAPTRGKCVPTDFLAGSKPKMWLSDRLAAQLGHAEEHQFCLAHLIRDAQYAIDHGDTIFAPDFKALLQDACAVGRRRPDLADATIAAHRRRLERELERLLALKPTDAEGRKLRDTVYVDCTDKLFAFLKRRGDNTVVTVVNLDPTATQVGVCVVPVSTGLPPAYPVRDLLSGAKWTWRIGRNYIKLGPGQSHLLRIGS